MPTLTCPKDLDTKASPLGALTEHRPQQDKRVKRVGFGQVRTTSLAHPRRPFFYSVSDVSWRPDSLCRPALNTRECKKQGKTIGYAVANKVVLKMAPW